MGCSARKTYSKITPSSEPFISLLSIKPCLSGLHPRPFLKSLSSWASDLILQHCAPSLPCSSEHPPCSGVPVPSGYHFLRLLSQLFPTVLFVASSSVPFLAPSLFRFRLPESTCWGACLPLLDSTAAEVCLSVDCCLLGV